jgi:hypothetical protein
MTRIEEIINIPMDYIFHRRAGFQPVDLVRLAMRCMERQARKGIRQTYAPNRFSVVLHPSDYRELYGFLGILRSEIKGELRRVVEERNYLLAGDLEVEIVEEARIKKGLPEVQAFMQGEQQPNESVVLEDEEKSATGSGADADDHTLIIEPPEPAASPAAGFDRGLTLLKEGRAAEAADTITLVDESEVDGVEYHAALGAAMEMMGRTPEAVSHYRNVIQLGGPQPLMQKRIAWLGHNPDDRAASKTHAETLGRLAIPAHGVVFHLRTDGIFVENQGEAAAVTVDGEASLGAPLPDGAVIALDGLELVYHRGTADE